MAKTFKLGGIHPHDNKLSRAVAIEQFPIPTTVTVMMGQHIGAPAVAKVTKGDKVLVGDLLGAAAGFVSANIHSPVSGTVTSVDLAVDGGGLRKNAVTIAVEGDEWNPAIDLSDSLVKDFNLTPAEIIEKITQAGIVGMGGATFPTQVKLSVPAGKKAEVLIVNGVECEPYLTADHRLMLEKGEELLVACRIVMAALGVTRTYIGIEKNKPDAIDNLSKLIARGGYDGIEVVALKVMYPQGGEKQLIDAVTRREVPSGALPVEVGAVVQNVSTMYAIYQAVQKNRPLVDRVVTVTGKSVDRPSNYLVRLGTPISSLIEAAGAMPEGDAKIINGGPMMGRAMANIESPVTKGTSGILVIGSKKATRPKAGVCISCAKCVGVCPMGLEPYLLYKMAKVALFEQLEGERVTDCIECGSCSFTCPARLPLLDYIRLGKTETMKIIRSRK